MFDKSAFMARSFSPRKGAVDVPDMKMFFPDGCKVCQWKVQGLTANELSACNEAADKMKGIAAMVEAVAGGSDDEKADAIKTTLGIDMDMQPDTVKRLEMLTRASVDMDVNLAFAVKISEVYPVEFFAITNEIIRLTGLGQEAGK